MPHLIISLYALDLLVCDSKGRIEEVHGAIECHRNGARFVRAYDDSLLPYLLQAAKSRARRAVVADAYPEFFTTSEEQ